MKKEPYFFAAGYRDVNIFKDERGSFRVLLDVADDPFHKMDFIQQNVSVSKKHVFRGLHYQLKYPQGKLVTVLNGRAIDYVIDLRLSSPRYGVLESYYLTAEKGETVWVPPGFAHGFLSLEDNTVFCYSIFENAYIPDDEYCINPHTVPQPNIFLKDIYNIAHIIRSPKDKKGLAWSESPKYGEQ